MSRVPKSKLPTELKLIRDGFIAGFFSGIAVKTGTSIDETSISLMILKEVCKVSETLKSPLNCWLIVGVIAVTAIIASILLVLKDVAEVDDLDLGRWTLEGWKLGLILYGVGFVVGFFLILYYA